MNKKALPKYVLYTKFSQQEVKDIIEEPRLFILFFKSFEATMEKWKKY